MKSRRSWLIMLGCLVAACPARLVGQATGTKPSLYSLATAKCAFDSTLRPDTVTGLPLIAVTPLGRVLHYPNARIDEGHGLEVEVLGDRRLVSQLSVSRTSDIRVGGAVRVLGGPPAAAAAGQQALPVCAWRADTLRDLAAGKGEFKVSVLWETTADTQDNVGFTPESLATVSFAVDALYSGALFFGPIVTGLQDPDYGIRVAGTDTTIAYTTRPGSRVEYALFFTPFWFSPRDVEVQQFKIDPMIGLVLNDIPNNVLVGFTAHWGYAVHLVGGLQVGVVRQLEKTAGLDVGKPVSGGAAAIPVANHIDASWFVGVGLDLRAVGALFSLVTK